MRIHELALQRWFYNIFFVREGYPIPLIFSTPSDAFSTFDKLWKKDNTPFKYLFGIKDEKGTPLYEPYPSNLRYPLISAFRRGWKYRTEQNYSIHRFRHISWPTVSKDVNKCQLGNVATSQRQMAWDYRWQIDHYAMRPDTQAYFVETLMRSMWMTGGVPQCWVKVYYPVLGHQLIRMYLDGDIENSTPEEPEDQKQVEFRTTFTLCMEGYSVDQNIQFVPALWSLVVRDNSLSASPGDIENAFGVQYEEDLRAYGHNPTLDSRSNQPPSEGCDIALRSTGTVTPDPFVIVSPHSLMVNEPDAATFNVLASGSVVTYQWRRDGTDMAGETGTTLTIDPTVAGDTGAIFDVFVTSDGQNGYSNPATLTVVPIPVDRTPTLSLFTNYNGYSNNATINTANYYTPGDPPYNLGQVVLNTSNEITVNNIEFSDAQLSYTNLVNAHDPAYDSSPSFPFVMPAYDDWKNHLDFNLKLNVTVPITPATLTITHSGWDSPFVINFV